MAEQVVDQTSTGSAKIIYILYLVGLFIGITSLIGVIMAYMNKDDGTPEWLRSHYQFQIRTFWIGLLYVIVGSLLSSIVIGFIILIFWIIWLVIRCVKGLRLLTEKQAIPAPTSWWF